LTKGRGKIRGGCCQKRKSAEEGPADLPQKKKENHRERRKRKKKNPSTKNREKYF